MIRYSIALLLLAAVFGSTPAATQQPVLPTLAVLDLADGGSLGPDAQNLSQLGKGLGSMITTEMMRNPRVHMVERDQIQQLLAEQKLGLSGMIDPATAIQVGKLLGARYMLFGSYTDVFSNLRIDVRVVEVETGKLQRAQEVTDKRENLFRSVNRLTNQLFKDLDLEPVSPIAAPPAVPAKAALLFSQGLGFEDAGDVQKAREMYQKALEAFPQYEDAKKRLNRLEGAK